MSEASSDGSLEVRRAPRTGAGAVAAGKITDLSDDSSDGGHPVSHPPSRPEERSPSPMSPGGSDEDGRDKDGQSRDRSDERDRDHVDDEDKDSDVDGEPQSPPRRVESAFRTAGFTGGRDNSVDIMHFPPNITLSSAVTTKLETVPVEQNPILYRLRPGFKGNRTAAEAVMDYVREKRGDPTALSEVLQSNAKLITWSDGSRTIAIGSQQFLLIEDAVASQHMISRMGDDIQTCESRVRSVVRVQPSSTSDARDKLALATAAMKKASKREGRTMLRCMDGDGEQEEMKAKEESYRKQRERARLEAKRRRARESHHVRPDRGLTVDILESDYESEEDVRKMAERVDADRLLRAKRGAPPRTLDVKRRKAGGRRVLGSDEDESDESD